MKTGVGDHLTNGLVRCVALSSRRDDLVVFDDDEASALEIDRVVLVGDGNVKVDLDEHEGEYPERDVDIEDPPPRELGGEEAPEDRSRDESHAVDETRSVLFAHTNPKGAGDARQGVRRSPPRCQHST